MHRSIVRIRSESFTFYSNQQPATATTTKKNIQQTHIGYMIYGGIHSYVVRVRAVSVDPVCDTIRPFAESSALHWVDWKTFNKIGTRRVLLQIARDLIDINYSVQGVWIVWLWCWQGNSFDILMRGKEIICSNLFFLFAFRALWN